jgi:hypothetical protein
MLRILLATCALCLGVTYVAAQSAGVLVRGCNYQGLEGCRYLKASKGGRVYQLEPGFGVMMPPPNLIITAAGTVKPKEVGFCTAKWILTASKIEPTKQRCRGPKQ